MSGDTRIFSRSSNDTSIVLPEPGWPRLLAQTGASTHPGRRRYNEDQYLIADVGDAGVRDTSLAPRDPADQLLLLVADGMGGHAAGEIASAYAARTMLDELRKTPTRRRNPGEILVSGIRLSDQRVIDLAREQPQWAGMGTTLTVAWVLGPMLYLAHVGDSRAYLYRAGTLRPLTRDQTLAEMLVHKGELTSEQSRSVKHILTDAVGGVQVGVEPQTADLLLEAEDVLVLCSDGLNRSLSDRDIADRIGNADSPQDAASELVAEALRRDDGDNITVVVARFLAHAARESRPH